MKIETGTYATVTLPNGDEITAVSTPSRDGVRVYGLIAGRRQMLYNISSAGLVGDLKYLLSGEIEGRGTIQHRYAGTIQTVVEAVRS